jgi:hypothetical protein
MVMHLAHWFSHLNAINLARNPGSAFRGRRVFLRDPAWPTAARAAAPADAHRGGGLRAARGSWDLARAADYFDVKGRPRRCVRRRAALGAAEHPAFHPALGAHPLVGRRRRVAGDCTPLAR